MRAIVIDYAHPKTKPAYLQVLDSLIAGGVLLLIAFVCAAILYMLH